jgi:RecB family exonuclease
MTDRESYYRTQLDTAQEEIKKLKAFNTEMVARHNDELKQAADKMVWAEQALEVKEALVQTIRKENDRLRARTKGEKK